MSVVGVAGLLVAGGVSRSGSIVRDGSGSGRAWNVFNGGDNEWGLRSFLGLLRGWFSP